METPRICPKCDGEVNAQLVAKWGDGQQLQPFAPFVCSWCASVLVLELATGKIIDPSAAGFNFMAILKQNAKLWPVIESTRAKILSLPNRRPVLR